MASRARGRPRKPRETRMDAAVDAMMGFGFEEKLIKITAKELLKVYGGSEAWPLIEEGCYSTLFEVLLNKNKEKEGRDEQSKSKNGEGCSQLDQPVLEPIPDATPAGNADPLIDAEPPFSDITDNTSGNDNTAMEESRGADAIIDVTAINPDGNIDITNGGFVPLAVVPPQPPVGTIPNQRRKPCYGWVSDEDEESDDIVYVPARLPEKPSARLSEKPRRRKTRWDVAPDEI